MAERYYPGLSISVPTDGKWIHTWSNDFVKLLPEPEHPHPWILRNGEDIRRPDNLYGGGYDVVFSILGEGRSVDFWAVSQGRQGNMLRLCRLVSPQTVESVDHMGRPFLRDLVEEVAYRHDGVFANWEGVRRTPATGVRYFLEAGVFYFLAIGSPTYDEDLDWEGHSGYGFDQIFSLEVEYTPADLNHSLETAHQVVIDTDGGTFNSVTVMNDGLSVNPIPDASNNGLFMAAYWKYVPRRSGTMRAWSIVTPANSAHMPLNMWEVMPDGSLSAWWRQDDVSVPVEAGHTYYLAIGYRHDPYGVTARLKYQLRVTAPTAPPEPEPEPAPPGIFDVVEMSLDHVWRSARNDFNNWSYGLWTRDAAGIHFGGQVAELWFYDEYRWGENTGVQFTVSGDTVVRISSSDTSMEIRYSSDSSSISLWAFGNERYESVAHPGAEHFRIYQDRRPRDPAPATEIVFHIEVSRDGVEWSEFGTSIGTDMGIGYSFGLDLSSSPYSVYMECSSGLTISDVHGIYFNPPGGGGPAPDPMPPIWNPPEAADPYNPGAELPDLESGSATLLELVRTFSSAVRRAVRITGPTSIAMVDPDVPLPDGWSDQDAPALYTSATRAAKAETDVLSLRVADATLTASTNVVVNDVRLLGTSWRIPDRLPMYGVTATAVQRFSYTFTPTTFTAVMEFHYASMPFETGEPDIGYIEL